MYRDLHNVRLVPEPGTPPDPTPLTEDEERRYQAVLFKELGDAIADRGRVSWPAHTPEDRRRLLTVAARLATHWNRPVHATPEDPTRMTLHLPDHEIPA
ncbi:hypothetical protein ACN20G_30990 (plasmid) [Streptomyces sp. BI20]|uniref:hypothetical protein n=1 Tax=Streptomyces sp. BI20 TaxID=3403460 RepID=UPI003C756EF0